MRLLAAIGASLTVFQSPVPACTSFAVYGRETWYGMNFDNADWDIRLSVTRTGGRSVFWFEFGNGLQLAAMNDAGVFANLQILDQNVPQTYTNLAGGLSMGGLYEYAIEYSNSLEDLKRLIAGRRIVPWGGDELHSLIADRDGEAMIVEPFGSFHGVVPKEGPFVVMTNFPAYDFIGREPGSVYGIGADRYRIAHAYISEHVEDFGYEEAWATLERSVQGPGAYFPTRASFVLNPDTREVFLCFARDFSKVWRLSMDDGTIETFSGFEKQTSQRIGAAGVWVSALRAGVGSSAAPVGIAQPKSRAAGLGERVVLSGAVSGGDLTYQWLRNGAAIDGATGTTRVLGEMRAEDAGVYQKIVTHASGTLVSEPAIVGVATEAKIAGGAVEVAANLRKSDGTVNDQVVLTEAAAAITAEHGRNEVTRVSYLVLDGDIVQVELSGPGTLSLVLEEATGPAAPTNYNQPVEYMKGHAGIVITGANEFSNVAVFSAGRATEADQTMFKEGVDYDGVADLAFIAIATTNGKFGSVRTSNVNYFAERGFTGVYAPGVAFQGPVEVGDVTAFDAAEPVLVMGSAADVRVAGGDMAQPNGQAVKVSGIARLEFVEGGDSHGRTWEAKSNRGVFRENGREVTGRIVMETRRSEGGSRFRGIATRARSGTGNEATIGGFVIDGGAPRRVLIRAVGRTLTTQGIGEAEVLADPAITVHDARNGNAVVATNDDWRENANAADIEAVAARLGVAPLAADDTRSAALLSELEPGVYSFVVTAKGGSPGVVLVEVYDVDPPDGHSRFAAISTRAAAATGNGVAIGGFVIEGEEPKRVLVRAVGPTLTTQGIEEAEVLADPMVTLHRGAETIGAVRRMRR